MNHRQMYLGDASAFHQPVEDQTEGDWRKLCRVAYQKQSNTIGKVLQDSVERWKVEHGRIVDHDQAVGRHLDFAASRSSDELRDRRRHCISRFRHPLRRATGKSHLKDCQCLAVGKFDDHAKHRGLANACTAGQDADSALERQEHCIALLGIQRESLLGLNLGDDACGLPWH